MVSAGDHVLLFHSEKMHYLLRVENSGTFSTHRGQIDHRQLLGRQFGDEIKTHLGFSFYLLKPSVADLALRVKRLTTVAYPKDVGPMLLETGIGPGSRVIECGTGSGALTLILAHLVRPGGRVYTYERRPEFSANARNNIIRHGLHDVCEFYVRDPGQEGFVERDVEAVILDVPEPWTLVTPARQALHGGSPLVAIVPTFEQLRRLTLALQSDGYVRIRCREILERQLLLRSTGIRPADRMVAHTVFVVTASKVNSPSPEPTNNCPPSDEQHSTFDDDVQPHRSTC